MDLADFRNQIDEIDQELMALFRRRMETVEQIAAYKEQHGLPVYDPQREEEKRTALLAQLPPALRKAPRSREMLRMQFDVVDRTRQYCTVPAGLWLQSLLLRLFPREYMWLRNIKGRGELKIA